MSSNINPYNIDGTFPVAGQDNSSQGFRDNFTNIKNNFAFAQSEINDLQTKTILTSALSGQTISNDMAGTQIVRPQLRAWTESYIDLGLISTGVASLDFTQASVYKVLTGGSITISFPIGTWPAVSGQGALGYGLLRLWVIVTNTAHIITLPSGVTAGVADLIGYDAATRTIKFADTGTYVFDFSSIDNGTNFLIEDPVRGRRVVRDNLRVSGNLNVAGNTIVSNSYVPTRSNSSGTAGQISYTDTHFYVCVSTNNWLRANLTAF
jgi:hypothetical protein